jgi:hypothetical protein
MATPEPALISIQCFATWEIAASGSCAFAIVGTRHPSNVVNIAQVALGVIPNLATESPMFEFFLDIREWYHFAVAIISISGKVE